MEKSTREQRQSRLLAEAQSGEAAVAAAATEALVRENMGLVRQAAFRFRERGIEYEDLVQIGTLGMLRAIRSFDLSRGLAFSTFAVPLIVGEIRRNLRDGGLLRVSRSYKQLGAELVRYRGQIQVEEGREATVDELAAKAHVTREDAAMALSAMMPVTSLSESVFEDDEGELSERITDDESANEPAILTDRLALGEAIGRMPPPWRKILLLRYYRNRTQQETADLLGISQVKVSREEKKILAFLRGEMTV